MNPTRNNQFERSTPEELQAQPTPVGAPTLPEQLVTAHEPRSCLGLMWIFRLIKPDGDRRPAAATRKFLCGPTG